MATDQGIRSNEDRNKWHLLKPALTVGAVAGKETHMYVTTYQMIHSFGADLG